MTLTRDQILAADDLRREAVDVPEWGGKVMVSAFTGKCRDAFEESITTDTGKPNLVNMRAKLAAMCIVDEKGKPLFTTADVEALGAKSSNALDRVVTVAQRLNRLGDSQLEELRGN
jgi:hypothetical protein